MIKEDWSNDVVDQCRISGQPLRRIALGKNFPHGSTDLYEATTLHEIQIELVSESINAQSSLPEASKFRDQCNGVNNVGLRQHHAANLNTIMHISLLNGDYLRASRAWSMLLRSEYGGHSFDLRKSDRWALGAEYLLNQHAQLSRPIRDAVGRLPAQDHHNPFRSTYNMRNIELAKDYYERLVLQYPHRKAFPNVTGPQQFFLALFGLWIFSIQEQYSLSMSVINNEVENTSSGDEIGLDGSYKRSIPDLEPSKFENTKAVGQETLMRAQQIVERLGDLLNSPPYLDDERFWELLGMVNLWIWDLSAMVMAQAEDKAKKDSPESDRLAMATRFADDDIGSPSQTKEQIERNRALMSAQWAFEKAKFCS